MTPFFCDGGSINFNTVDSCKLQHLLLESLNLREDNFITFRHNPLTKRAQFFAHIHAELRLRIPSNLVYS